MNLGKHGFFMVNSICDLFSLVLLLLLTISIIRHKNREPEMSILLLNAILLFYGICVHISAKILWLRHIQEGDALLTLTNGGNLTAKFLFALACPLLALYAQKSLGKESPSDWARGAVWFAISLIFPVAALIFHILWKKLELYGAGFTLMLYSVYLYHQIDMEKELLEKELALTRSRVQLLTGQISPHFIFNSIQVIQNLCDEEQEKVKPALSHFSEYLRSNLESMTNPARIPFERELSHAKEYLFLEQLGDSKAFDVIYRLAVTDFTLPPLTLEPIVENAARYGIGTKEEGGVIIIETEENALGISIRVMDDGRGKDSLTNRQKERQSVGMANVKARLAAQCGGSLSIEKSGNGTTVTLFIPKKGG